MTDMYADEPLLDFVVAEDLLAHAMQDTSLPDVLTAMLFHKGFTALTTYRLMHWLWSRDRQNLARYLQSVCSEVRFGLPERVRHGQWSTQYCTPPFCAVLRLRNLALHARCPVFYLGE